MKSPDVPKVSRDLDVGQRPIEVVLADDAIAPATIVFPSFDDLSAMHELRHANWSLNDICRDFVDARRPLFSDELDKLKKKWDKYRHSPTYLNQLANLAELAGKTAEEEEYLQEAKKISQAPFFDYRIAEVMLHRGDSKGALSIFENMDLATEVVANLRLAFFEVNKSDFQKAQLFVSKAVQIDPEHFGARLFEGALRLVQGEYESAIQSFRVADSQRPNSSVLHTNWAITYIQLSHVSKALRHLHRAVALDPLNENAVSILADISFRENRNEEAIPSLRYILQFEQKNPSLWARLARALIHIGELDDAIVALRREGSLETTPALWNNLGVAHYVRKDRENAKRNFLFAMESATEHRDFFLAARNFSQMVAETGDLVALEKFTAAVLADDQDNLVARNLELSDIWVGRLFSLDGMGRTEEAVKFSHQLISDPETVTTLKVWAAASLITYYVLSEGGMPNALGLAHEFEHFLSDAVINDLDLWRRNILANNIMFAYAEAGQIKNAEGCLRYLQGCFHRDPYPTATLGLLNIRKGNTERGFHLYEEAIGLAVNRGDKARIRQKLNIEAAVLEMDKSPGRARRLLEKVTAMEGGSVQLQFKATALLHALPNAG